MYTPAHARKSAPRRNRVVRGACDWAADPLCSDASDKDVPASDTLSWVLASLGRVVVAGTASTCASAVAMSSTTRCRLAGLSGALTALPAGGSVGSCCGFSTLGVG